MRLVPTNSVLEGCYLGKTLYDNNGRVLLRQGSLLSEGILRRISALGIYTLYITDEYSSGIIEDVIEPQIRQSAIQNVKTTFEFAARSTFTNNPSKANSMMKEREEAIKAIVDSAQSIIDEIFSRKNILVNLVDIKSMDNYTYQHSVNVAILSMILGLKLSMSKYELYTLCVGAMLHDIGKMFVPIEIIQKAGKLSDKEFDVIKEHTTKGYEYLKEINNISPVARIVSLQHHERVDGGGYTEHKKDADIHRLSKIVAIADVYDALTSDRPYRKAMLPSEALEYIMAYGGSQFDYKLVSIFTQTIVPYPEGSFVKLSNGGYGVIHEVSADYPLRPIVKILKGEGANTFVNLQNQLDVVIEETLYAIP